MKRLTVAGVALRLLWYVAIALAFLTLCGLYVAYDIHSGRHYGFPLQWVSLAAFTPLIFWSAVRVSKDYWRRPMYWLLLAGLLTLHILGFVILLQECPGWRAVWFIPAGLVEGWIIFLVPHWVFHRR